MSKLLKLIYSISLFFIFGLSFGQKDSLPNHKRQFFLVANIGVPVYNKFKISSNEEPAYWVSSKSKLFYMGGFELNLNKFNIGLTVNYMQNEFTSHDFGFLGGYYPKGNSHNGESFKPLFNNYVKTNYTVLQLAITPGVHIIFNKKHSLNINVSITSDLFNKTIISNYYSENQPAGYDTTYLYYSLLTYRNKLPKNKVLSVNCGFFPSVGFNLAYQYKITNYLFFDFKLVTQYLKANVFDVGFTDTPNEIIMNTAVLEKHFFIAPAVGLKLKLF